jgi:argininosuccinate lyase
MDLHPDTDLYMQMEAFVRARAPLGGGKMHLGRSRNDLYACAARMMTRDKLAAMLTSVLGLQRAVLAKAKEHAATVMPGYTHLQHAEPVTLGHFLLAFHDALERDVVRLADAYATANQNALGAAALSGSSFALDRDRTAALLGFEGVVENSYDAVAARDYILQAATAVAVLASTIARVADTLIVWSTSEFGMIDMPDSYAYTSSIMPQKRNPGYFFESVRAKASRVEGDLMGALVTMKGTTFIQSRETSFEVTVPVFRALGEALGAVEVVSGAITSMIVQAQRMRDNCAGEFSGATEIANFLVKDHGLDFRSGYQVVASLVRIACEKGMRPAEVDAKFVDEVARAEIGRPVGMSDALVRQALDPAGNVELKVTVGSPCLSEMTRMLAARDTRLAASSERHQQRLDKLQQGDRALEAAIHR